MIRISRVRTAFAGLVLAAVLGGCGFQPLYTGPGYQLLPGLEIDAGNDRVGYLVEDALRDFIGDGRSPYRVEIQSEFVESPLGLSAAGRATRFRAELRTVYRLTGPEGFEYIGRATEAVFYDAPRDPYALIAARSAGEERAAEQIAERLAIEFATAIQRAEDEQAS